MAIKGLVRRWLDVETEVRAAYSDGYTQARIEGQEARADSYDAIVEGVAYIAAGVKAIESAFALCEVKPGNGPVTPLWLSEAIRATVLYGQAVFKIMPGNGGAVLAPVSVDKIRGPRYDPANWQYKVDGRRGWLPGADILHLTFARTGGQYSGQSPLSVEGNFYGFGQDTETTALALEIERTVTHESRVPSGRIYSVPQGLDDNTIANYSLTIARLEGQAALFDTTEQDSNLVGGIPSRGQGDWTAKSIGPAPDEQLLNLRESVKGEILAALGVPLSVIGAAGNDAAAREEFRRFLHQTLNPLARRIEAEVSLKLSPVKITFPDIYAADIQARARAYKSLVDGGMDKDRAAELCGLA